MHTRVELPENLSALAASQAGVLTTEQLSQLSLGSFRRIRADWMRLSRGLWCVKEPTWESLAWAGLLRGGECALLGGTTAAHVEGLLSKAPVTITVWVPSTKSIPALEWGTWTVQFRRGERLAIGCPPRTRIEETLLDSTLELDADSMVAIVSRALADRRTTPSRILQRAALRERVGHRAILKELCSVAGEGIESVLEWHYAQRVERRHRLPLLERQAGLDSRARLDGLYVEFGLAVELDGRAFHDVSKDMTRDNRHILLHGVDTLRYGWHAVTTQPCFVADQVAQALKIRGWNGRLRRCTDCPSA